MADNTQLSAGTADGAVIATDDVASVHYQKVKLVDGTADSTTVVEAGGGTEAGALRVTIASDSTGVVSVDDNGSTISVDDGAGSLTVDNAALSVTGTGTESGALRVTLATDSTGLVSVDDNGGSLTVDNAALAVTGTGTESGALRVTVATDSTGVLSVDDNGGSITVDNAALSVTGNGADTSALRVTLANTSTGTVSVDGKVAHDAVDSGNPLKLGAKATNSLEGLTQVAAGDRTQLYADLNGVLITRPHTTLEEILSERVTNTDGASTAFSTFAAGGAGVHNYVTTISIYNSSSTDGYVDFRDGVAGAVIFTAPAPQTGGSVITFPVPLKGADNTALAYDVSGALSTVHISVIGFQAQG